MAGVLLLVLLLCVVVLLLWLFWRLLSDGCVCPHTLRMNWQMLA